MIRVIRKALNKLHRAFSFNDLPYYIQCGSEIETLPVSTRPAKCQS